MKMENPMKALLVCQRSPVNIGDVVDVNAVLIN